MASKESCNTCIAFVRSCGPHSSAGRCRKRACNTDSYRHCGDYEQGDGQAAYDRAVAAVEREDELRAIAMEDRRRMRAKERRRIFGGYK